MVVGVVGVAGWTTGVVAEVVGGVGVAGVVIGVVGLVAGVVGVTPVPDCPLCTVAVGCCTDELPLLLPPPQAVNSNAATASDNIPAPERLLIALLFKLTGG